MTPAFTFKILKREKNLGEKLLYYRKRQKLTIGQIEQTTGIRSRYIESLEKNKFEGLPSDVYAIGFLARYSKLLNLDPKKIIDQYKKEKEIYKNIHKKNLFLPDVKNRIKESRVFITPKLIIFAVSLLLFFSLAGYIFYQIKGFIAAPPLELNISQDDMLTNENKLSLEGKTDNGADLFINNELVSVESNGEFSKTVHLASGLNTIEVVAKNKIKKVTKKTIQVLAKY